MWDDLVKNLADFPSAVLTGTDITDYPFSIRCNPKLDTDMQVLRVHVPEATGIQPGPAGLLCHKHDEWLWNLKSFIVRGALERDDQEWIFHPRRFIPGAGIGGLIQMVKFLRSGRRTTKRYLEKRGLPRLSIPWDKFHALWAELKNDK